MSRECDLNTVDDVLKWFQDPAHQIKTDLFVVRWVGATPYISTGPSHNRLADMEHDPAFAQVVLLEHRRRRTRPRPEDSEMETSDE